ncbi:toll/interleukin-1 receptor domain-containing protein [Actinoplanes sp. NPDC049681]|uniref:toll/interleukin-1 receptor domain-containing protein n=1 Tax=Actinoplanes sp. NPDC049681 TaxID=3363905 RepID=UPI0037AB6736
MGDLQARQRPAPDDGDLRGRRGVRGERGGLRPLGGTGSRAGRPRSSGRPDHRRTAVATGSAGPVGWDAMSAPVRLFVSHSSKTRRDKKWLQDFDDALTAADDDIRLLYDRATVHAGERWRECIYWMLWECHAAVVLLTPAALKSPWVMREASFLEARTRRNRAFALVPVMLGGVDRARLERDPWWRTLQLSELQEPSSQDPGSVAAEVRAMLGSRLKAPEPSLTSKLATQIAACLRDATPDQCRETLTALGEPPGHADDKNDLARSIAYWIISNPPPSLSRAADALLRLGRAFPTDRIQQILDIIAPLWVDPEAAARFLITNDERDGARHLAIRCGNPQTTIQHHVSCAYIPEHRGVVPLHGVSGGMQVQDIAEELYKVLRSMMPSLRNATGEQIERRLATNDRPTYVSVGLPHDTDVIEELRGRFPTVTFVYHAPYDGESMPAEVPQPPWLNPAVRAEDENAVLSDMVHAETRLLGSA